MEWEKIVVTTGLRIWGKQERFSGIIAGNTIVIYWLNMPKYEYLGN